MSDPIFELLPSDIERIRYAALLDALAGRRGLFCGRRVLDFGASWGTSAVALTRLGAIEVIGVEPSASRVEQGRDLIARAAPGTKISLMHTADTARLPFADGEFPFILANGVLEHIPSPRRPYICEIWRLLSAGGHFMVSETPNKYFPKEMHTTALWFNHWLPKQVAHRRAIRRGRFGPERRDWDSSGWRGLGYFELVEPLRDYGLVPESSRMRHRLLTRFGIPASLLDPAPIWVLMKSADSRSRAQITG